ncbi:MAG: PEP-CTERM sorting domain-containing protein [Akkermansiaceae bacterium]|jgi:hypothetical protein
MKNTLTTIFCLCGAVSQGATILNQADWDGIDQLNDGNNGASVAAVSGGDAPAGSNGSVASIDVSGGNVWGAVNPPGSTLTIPDNVVRGEDTFTATFRMYIPSTTTFSGTDRVNLIVRRNNNNGGGNFFENIVWDSLDSDVWHDVTVSGVVPEFENDGTTAVTGLTPILSFYDRNDGANTAAGAGTAAFIDDWSFSVTTAVPEPTTGLAALLGLGLMGLRRRR